MSLDATVVPMRADHWPHVAAIYAEGIAGGHATFEHATPTWEAFDASRLPDHRFVAVDPDGTILGWIAVSPVSRRPVYAGVVEHSVYVRSDAHRRGVGGELLAQLITSTEGAGIWTIQSAIFPENAASLALHERHGFRVVGRRERIARSSRGPMAGQWRDTVVIERRSAVAGA